MKMDDSLTVSSRIDALAEVRAFVESRLDKLDLSHKERANVNFCLVEAVVNAMNHGNLGDPAKKVRISLISNHEKVTLGIRDEGAGFSPEEIPNPTAPDNIINPSGRGIFFMRQMMNEVRFDFDESGTTVTLVKKYNGRA